MGLLLQCGDRPAIGVCCLREAKPLCAGLQAIVLGRGLSSGRLLNVRARKAIPQRCYVYSLRHLAANALIPAVLLSGATLIVCEPLSATTS